ncbi:MAG: hypothetical protein HY784_19055 [Chloroflexi bacterium]|nr:hypothetical protein [Chloroflexota bacterium]
MKPKIPEFDTFEDIAEFWDTHDFSDYIDETEPVEIEVNLGNRLVGGRISVLEKSAAVCPVDGSELLRAEVDYTRWSRGHPLVIRRVPVRVCDSHGHRFVASEVAREIEATFERDWMGQLKPEEMIVTPVVTLRVPA